MTIRQFIHRGHFFYYFGYWVYELLMDMLIGGVRLNKMLDNSQVTICDHPVQSTPYRLLDLIVDYFQLDVSDVFVDVGCGWGRVISFLMLKFKMTKTQWSCKFVGIEINTKAANIAKKRFRDFKQVEIINSDILLNIPRDATVFYLFNPFGEKDLVYFINSINKKINHPVRLLYLNDVYGSVINNATNWFLIKRMVIKPKYHLPIKLGIYQYIP